ncbi:MAG: protein kinase [Deltaproteobacteria bacterium]
MARQRLGDVLLELGFIDEERLDDAVVEARLAARALGRYLVEAGDIEEDVLVSALSRHLGVPTVDPLRTPVHPRVLELVPAEVANTHRVIPIARKRHGDGESLFLATTDPFADDARRAVEALLPVGTNVSWLLCSQSDLAAALVHYYGDSTEDLPFAEADLVEATAATPRETFGGYELGRRIGKGGMAEIFVANVKGATVPATLAIKRLLPKLARDEEARKAFVGEAELSVGLRHPNIVQVHDLGEADGVLFIAMEHVEGCDLLQVLGEYAKQEKDVPIAVALHIVVQILQGLDYCHDATDVEGASLGIVHRDVSPSNVLLSRAGEVKLSDFGIARAQGPAGKSRYMAPEQLAGEPIERRTDVFAAGLLAFELLTRRPLVDTDAEAVFRTLDTDFVARLRHHRDDLPEALESILAQALATQPDDRFATAAAMREAIRGVVVEHGWDARAPDVAAFVEAVIPEGAAVDTQERAAYPRPLPRYEPNAITTLIAHVERAYEAFRTAPPLWRAGIVGLGTLVVVVVLLAASGGDAP